MAFGKCKVYCGPVNGEEMPASRSPCHRLPSLCDPGNQIGSDSHLWARCVALRFGSLRGSPLGIRDSSEREGHNIHVTFLRVRGVTSFQTGKKNIYILKKITFSRFSLQFQRVKQRNKWCCCHTHRSVLGEPTLPSRSKARAKALRPEWGRGVLGGGAALLWE